MQYFKNGYCVAAKKVKCLLNKIKVVMFQHMMNTPIAIPIIAKLIEVTLPKYSGAKNKASAPKLFIKPLMSALAEQIEVVVGQDRGKAIGVVEIDHPLSEAGAQLICVRTVGEKAGKQPVFVDTCQCRRLAMRVDRVHLLRFRQKCAHDRSAAFGVGAKILKGIGVATFQDRIGLGTELRHAASRAGWDKIRTMRAATAGTASTRWASSVSSASNAFSSRKKSTIRCAARGSSGQIEEPRINSR